MIDLLLFTQYPNAYAPLRFLDEALKLNLNIKVYDYNSVTENKNLSQAKSVIFREPNVSNELYGLRDSILHRYLRNSKILNKETYLTWSQLDKLTQHAIFQKESIPHIKLRRMEDVRFPYIVKNKLGSHGSHVFKIESNNDLDEVFKKGYRKEDLLVQEFQTAGFDLRAIVLDGKVLGVMKRIAKEGQYLTNFSQGGNVSKYNGADFPMIKEIALKTSKAFKLDFAGIDLMMGNDGEWKVLEVNRACQFEGFESATKVNVAKEIIDFLINIKKSA